MNKIAISLLLIISTLSCQNKADRVIKVINNKELQTAIANAQPGDVIEMSNGIWRDVEILFKTNGTEKAPITLKAETPGKVFIEGVSYLKFGGDHLIVKDLYFRNGYTPVNTVVDFKLNEEVVANHCRITQCVIKDFNQLSRDKSDHWIELWGKNNQMDHCYIAGKSNEGPTLLVEIKGNKNIRNHHKIIHNHFGPRPRKGGPKAETIRLGDSSTSMSPSNTLVVNNLFEKCNGEIEVISSKTNFNEFRNNVFFKCEGSLVTRHGNYCVIDGNFFIGDESSPNIGGIRIINTGHSVTNNYFIDLRGEAFRSPLAIMNGIPNSPLNRYNQVTDVTVVFNTWVNCKSPWHIGVGNNIDQKDVLPTSEIRSAHPIRTEIANNILYNETGDPTPIVVHSKTDGIKFESNIINNQGISFKHSDLISTSNIRFYPINDYLWVPKSKPEIEAYKGFGYDKISKDIFGNSRTGTSWIGAMTAVPETPQEILDYTKYGPDWFSPVPEKTEPSVLKANSYNIIETLENAKEGDIIELTSEKYIIQKPLIIDKKITIKSAENIHAIIEYSGNTETPLFAMHPKGDLTLQDISISGKGNQIAFAPLRKNMSSHYMLTVNNCNISNFDYVLKAYKNSFAQEIEFKKTSIKDCNNGLELSAEKDDKGDYNVEFLTIDSCSFKNVRKNVIDYYRGGYDESTIGGNLLVSNSLFQNCGDKEENRILINTYGIINVKINNNTFKNNPVKLVARLWGAKNNSHSDNTIVNSGKIIVEDNLKLKLIY
ncbi:chondroitinase-B domain-containing protein [Anaerophaga thermohalophila]|uniref:chondroitinase-B domain-containing protein n=1 Tax=Anaerophaga thermohalophila TaxID=177400 RepID=UPI000237C0B8|nr:chondroitinase-B domain-containing protein [Anaerophaga thermohalophila]